MLMWWHGLGWTAPRTNGGKVFASVSTRLYAGLAFLRRGGSGALAPIVHRLMHKFHWQERSLGSSCCAHHGRLTLRCTRSATAGFARFRTRVNSNVRLHGPFR